MSLEGVDASSLVLREHDQAAADAHAAGKDEGAGVQAKAARAA